MSESKSYNGVKKFHKVFHHPVGEKPTAIFPDIALTRTIWTGEELIEFLHASAGGDRATFLELVNGFMDGLDRAVEKSLKAEAPDDILVAQMDALTDAKYFIYGSFVVAGVDPQPLHDIVQAANMAKLGPDGKPIVRESDGKTLKPEGWEPPEGKLALEIKRQIEEANHD